MSETRDFCGWCYGPLSPDDLQTRLGRALATIESGACADCVAAERVMHPMDSLYPTEARLSEGACIRQGGLDPIPGLAAANNGSMCLSRAGSSGGRSPGPRSGR